MDALEIVKEGSSESSNHYKCKICGHIASEGLSFVHLAECHPGWQSIIQKNLTKPQSVGNKTSISKELVDESADHANNESASSSEVSTQGNKTVHNNPNWCSDLIHNFKSVIFEKCSQRVKDAVENDEDIQNKKLRREVDREIINQTIDYLKVVFGGVDSPSM